MDITILEVWLIIYSVAITIICLREEIIKIWNKKTKPLPTAGEIDVQRKKEQTDFVLESVENDYKYFIRRYIEFGEMVFVIKECYNNGEDNDRARKLLKLFRMDKEYWQLYKGFLQDKGWFVKELYFNSDKVEFEISTTEK